MNIQDKNMQKNSKVLNEIISRKKLIMTSLDLDIIRQKRDQSPKQQNKKHIQKAMQKQSRGI